MIDSAAECTPSPKGCKVVRGEQITLQVFGFELAFASVRQCVSALVRYCDTAIVKATPNTFAHEHATEVASKPLLTCRNNYVIARAETKHKKGKYWTPAGESGTRGHTHLSYQAVSFSLEKLRD